MSIANRISGRLRYGGVLIVPVKLDGLRLYFMVDSGAAFCAINQKLLDKIFAQVSDFKLPIAPVGKEYIHAPTLQIKSFSAGSMVQSDIMVSVVDFPEGFQLDGLLGMNFLGKYRFTIEPDTATLILRNIPLKKTK